MFYEGITRQRQPAQKRQHRQSPAGGRKDARSWRRGDGNFLDRHGAHRRLHRLRRLRQERRMRLRWSGRRVCPEGEDGRRLCVRKPGPLRGGVRQYDVVPGPRVLFSGCGRVPLQAGGGCDGSAPRRHTSSYSSTPASRICRLSPASTGTWSTARTRRTSSRTSRACRPCAHSGAIWRGCFTASRRAKPQASSIRRSNHSSARISSAESKCIYTGRQMPPGIFLRNFCENTACLYIYTAKYT